jgi:hypothetical protein
MRDNRKLIFLSLSLTLVFAIYFIGWHYTSLVWNGSYSVIDISGQFMSLSFWYLLVSVVLSSIITAILLVLKRTGPRKIFIWTVLVLFFGSEIIRIFDWGALYFGGNHIDSNFWAHAFYADGLIYLVTKQALILYATAAFFGLAVYLILMRFLSLKGPEGRQ